MNWTEGNLARHSRGRRGKEMLLRQKQYFAKARAGAPGGAIKKSPITISFLDGVVHPALPQSKSSPSIVRNSPNTKILRPRRASTANESSRPSKTLLQSSPYFQDASQDTASKPSRQRGQELEVVNLNEKRRRLLLRGDWVGVNIQKPINVQFPRSGSNLAKWGRAKARQYHSLRHKARHQLGIRYDEMSHNSNRIRGSVLDRQITVRIGSQDFKDGRRLSSDLQSRREQQPKYHASAQSRHNNHGLSSSISHIPRLGQENDSRAYSSSLQPDDHSHPQPYQSSGSMHILTSSPLIYQPFPQRLERAHILISGSEASGSPQSTAAQVGRNRPTVLSSQHGQNEMWKTFVCSSDDKFSAVFQGGPNIHNSGNISPGISELQPPCEPNVSPAPFEQSSRSPWAEQDVFCDSSSVRLVDLPTGESITSSSEIDARGNLDSTSMKLNSVHPKVTENNYMTDFSNIMDTNRKLSLRTPELHSNTKRFNEVMIQESPDHKSTTDKSPKPAGGKAPTERRFEELKGKVSIGIAPSFVESELDEEDAWRKFVFPDFNHEDELAAMGEATQEAARTSHPSDPLDEQSRIARAGSVSLGDAGNDDFSSTEGRMRQSIASETTFSERISDIAEIGSLVPSTGCTRLHYTTSTIEAGSSTTGTSEGGPAPSVATGVDSLSVEPPQSLNGEPKPSFKFAAPKLFVGKLSSEERRRPSQPGKKPTQLSSRNPKRKGAGKKKQRQDGRTDIREVPDYSGDPIEEFDEVDLVRLPPSLLGALEME